MIRVRFRFLVGFRVGCEKTVVLEWKLKHRYWCECYEVETVVVGVMTLALIARRSEIGRAHV